MPKRRINASKKGGNFERTIARSLSLWVTNLEDPDGFYRSQGSGSRQTYRKKEGKKNLKDQVGDIAPQGDDPRIRLFSKHFSIECKAYKDGKLPDLFWNPNNFEALNLFWRKPAEEAEHVGKVNLTILKQNFRPPVIVVDEVGKRMLGYGAKDGFPYHIYVRTQGLDLYVAQYDVFITKTKWKRIHTWLRREVRRRRC